MSVTPFPISHNTTQLCFTPLTCATDLGHLVAWGFGTENGATDVMVKVCSNTVLGVINKIATIEHCDSLLFLRRFNTDSYMLAVENETGSLVYILDSNGRLLKTLEFSEWIVCYCCQSGEQLTVFGYNYNENRLDICAVNPDDTTDYELLNTYTTVYGFPEIFITGNYFIAGWITADDELQIIHDSIQNISQEPFEVTIDNFNVDYLIATQVSATLFAFGGYNQRTEVLRFDYVRADDSHCELLCSKYWKTNDYKKLTFKCAALDNGFMLLADGPGQESVLAQRFTHLGTFLYPLVKLTSDELPTWDANLSQGTESTLVVYLKDYGDHSEVWGKWLNVGTLPEIEHMCIEDL